MIIVVFSKQEAECCFYYGWKVPHIWISVCGSTYDYFPALPENEQRLDVLQLRVDDIERAEKGFVSFDRSHARTVLDFVDKWKDQINAIGVNCEAGVSRSAGIAEGLCRYFGKPQQSYSRFGWTCPNRLVVAVLIREALRRKGVEKEDEE